MEMFADLGLTANIAVFAAAAVVVWIAGARLVALADALADRTGLGRALLGLLLLAGVTSLPEVATSLTAAGIGDAPLAINNLLGSVVMQVALLAVADFIISRRALTAIVPDPVVMLQGALNVCLLATVVLAALAPEIAFLGAGFSQRRCSVSTSLPKLAVASLGSPATRPISVSKPENAKCRKAAWLNSSRSSLALRC